MGILSPIYLKPISLRRLFRVAQGFPRNHVLISTHAVLDTGPGADRRDTPGKNGCPSTKAPPVKRSMEGELVEMRSTWRDRLRMPSRIQTLSALVACPAPRRTRTAPSAASSQPPRGHPEWEPRGCSSREGENPPTRSVRRLRRDRTTRTAAPPQGSAPGRSGCRCEETVCAGFRRKAGCSCRG
jgi:hypothetical protein